MANKMNSNRANVSSMSVHELAKLAGISVRALHYYDQIGLLAPAKITDAGYRLYDETSLERLQEIMLFRELEFPLKDIKRIIDNPGFDRKKALDDQIKILELKRDHFNDLLKHAKEMKNQEDKKMDFKVYDTEKIEGYKKLAKETWGETEAYKEFEKKNEGKTDIEQRKQAEDLMDLFYEFGDLKALEPGDEKVQVQVKKLQDFITEKYYTCTNQILFGLGQMYAAGGDFTKNIDVAGGKGCAEFVAKAIEIYCK